MLPFAPNNAKSLLDSDTIGCDEGGFSVGSSHPADLDRVVTT